MYSPEEVAEYYNHTQHHYIRWWNLKSSLALHYGIWEKETVNFSQALENTNRLMMELADINDGDHILDAGCGVGGAAIYLAKAKNIKVTGITLSEVQLELAEQSALDFKISERVKFHIMDFTKTEFVDEFFDVVWACESMCHAANREAFIDEAYRILKRGGRLVISDYFLSKSHLHDPANLLGKWLTKWRVAQLTTLVDFAKTLEKSQFKSIRATDYSMAIRRSSRRMYFASLAGAIPSILYNVFHPRVSKAAAQHYQSGYYQFKALKRGLWNYVMLVAVKK